MPIVKREINIGPTEISR